LLKFVDEKRPAQLGIWFGNQARSLDELENGTEQAAQSMSCMGECHVEYLSNNQGAPSEDTQSKTESQSHRLNRDKSSAPQAPS
jgi:hypothetical protein